MKKYCEYDLTGDYGIGYTTNKHSSFYFDLEDYEKIKNFAWRLSPIGYIVSYNPASETIVYLHRWVMPDCTDCVIDHINRIKIDNRKSNLRITSQKNNIHNGSKRTTNTSGIIGVAWRKERSKWIAYIDCNYKRKYLGHYTNKEDAIKARLKAELAFFGKDYAPQRHLFKEYDIN